MPRSNRPTITQNRFHGVFWRGGGAFCFLFHFVLFGIFYLLVLLGIFYLLVYLLLALIFFFVFVCLKERKRT